MFKISLKPKVKLNYLKIHKISNNLYRKFKITNKQSINQFKPLGHNQYIIQYIHPNKASNKT